MRTARLLTVSQHALTGECVSQDALDRGMSAQGGACPGGVCPGGCMPGRVFAQGCMSVGGVCLGVS